MLQVVVTNPTSDLPKPKLKQPEICKKKTPPNSQSEQTET